MAYNFNKRAYTEVDLYGTKFDFNSVMLYDSYAFSTNGKATMLRKSNNGKIARTMKMSGVDILRLKKRYNCRG
ncbi:Uncharacterised protein r2_g1298 [Pycnogonum litorale]